MRVLCAWCLKEGKPETEALIGEHEPLGEDGPPSHGICPHHRREVEDRVAAFREEIQRHAEHQREEAERRRREAAEAERRGAEIERQRAEVEELRRQVDP